MMHLMQERHDDLHILKTSIFHQLDQNELSEVVFLNKEVEIKRLNNLIKTEVFVVYICILQTLEIYAFMHQPYTYIYSDNLWEYFFNSF